MKKKKTASEKRKFVARNKRVQEMACMTCGRIPSQNAHLLHSRGAGGKDSDVVPLCYICHNEQHTQGIHTFMKKYGLTEAMVIEETKRIQQVFEDEGL